MMGCGSWTMGMLRNSRDDAQRILWRTRCHATHGIRGSLGCDERWSFQKRPGRKTTVRVDAVTVARLRYANEHRIPRPTVPSVSRYACSPEALSTEKDANMARASEALRNEYSPARTPGANKMKDLRNSRSKYRA